MEVLQSIFLGLVQGVTEVLPISSSGHLVLMPWFFDFKDPGLVFDIAVHLGTFFAIFYILFDDIKKILSGGADLLRKRDLTDTYQGLFIFLMAATIPGILAGVFLEQYAKSTFRNPLIIAGTLFGFAILLYLADKNGSKKRNLQSMTLYQSLAIGAAQALAIVPGVSRSGVTITAGLFTDLRRDDAARFSFLLSLPIIIGASVFGIKDIGRTELFSVYFLVGFISSFIAGFLSVKFLLNYIKNHNFNIFVVYRIILAVAIVAIYFFKI